MAAVSSCVILRLSPLCLSIRTVYNELHQTIMSISDHDDLRWWKNAQGPGMATNWPKFENPQRHCIKQRCPVTESTTTLHQTLSCDRIHNDIASNTVRYTEMADRYSGSK
ncbi:UNVERIFIED_CONTAM: hypothetical protein FKN15_009707 [Acipenser sinensis]